MAVVAAFVYGSTAIFAEALIRQGMSGPTVIGFRFLGAAMLLLPVMAILGRPLLPEKGERVSFLLVGAFGYAPA